MEGFDATRTGASSGRPRARDERGVVIVWLAVTLVLLLGVTALGVDVAYWQVTKNREQRAADAAALAGAVSFPGDGTAANAAAGSLAQSNGYGSGAPATATPADSSCTLAPGSDTAICGGAGDQTYRYKVTVLRRVQNFFGGVFGIKDTTVRASAQAEYLKPLTMGSPSNQFGNDPDSITSWPLTTTKQTYPNFWANVAGGNSTKVSGDAYTAGQCDGATDGCSSTNVNLDKKAGGYYYAVDFTSAATVNLQAFDPAFVNVGDTCGSGNLAGASALTSVPGYPEGNTPAEQPDWAKRYSATSDQATPGFQYCTGDNLFGSGPAPATTYTVLKATVPGNPNAAVPVSTCSPITYPGFSGAVMPYLRDGTKTDVKAPGILASYFRQWVNLCQVSGLPGDEYFIEVQTDANSQGHNRFSLRGIPTSGPTDPEPVTVAGNTYMAIYANVASKLTEFYLARVPTAAAHHTLVLNFFDIGDASSEGTLTIVPPTDSNVGTKFNDCTWSGQPGGGAEGFATNTPVSPWGPLNPIDGCKITGVNHTGTIWQGQWSTVTIPIPADYKCDDSDPNGCWVKIDYLFPNGGITDTTSWNAFLVGDPVRLTK
jgi:hypothetical protein